MPKAKLAATDIETRGTAAEFRVEGENGMTLVGYAAVTGVETVIGDWWREKVAPGAFRNALERGDDTRALLNHNADIVLGRTTSGTLVLDEDEHGLRAVISLDPNNPAHVGLASGVKRGDLSQMSFGFVVEAEEVQRGEDGELPLRTITDLELFDVSVVTYPAYPTTTVSARDRFSALEKGPLPDVAAATAARARRLRLAELRMLW